MIVIEFTVGHSHCFAFPIGIEDPQLRNVPLTGGINGGENSGSEWLHVVSVVLLL